jgi:hypothetical protein
MIKDITPLTDNVGNHLHGSIGVVLENQVRKPMRTVFAAYVGHGMTDLKVLANHNKQRCGRQGEKKDAQRVSAGRRTTLSWPHPSCLIQMRGNSGPIAVSAG